MMPALLDMATCPNLAVPVEVMQHVVKVESDNNPFAIGVVGARLERQPLNLDEAVATARMLDSKGYNFSLGVAQVNRYNLAKYGLDTYQKAFDVCPNLSAGTRILAQCYAKAGGDWGKSFSCYYSGNFSKGYDDGYVQKVYTSINRALPAATVPTRTIPIQLAQYATPLPATSAEYRIRMRSSAIDPLGAALVAGASENELTRTHTPPTTPVATAPNMPFPRPADVHMLANNQPTAITPSDSEIFVPEVHRPNDAALPVKRDTVSSQPTVDRADTRLGGHDSAFVF
jgi:type IV secretion system protein VirB1